MKTTPLLRLVVKAIEDIKGLDIKVLDVARLTTITDHMVVCTGTSNRHVRATAENIIKCAKEAGYRPLGIEGLDASEWVLVDLGDVVAHVMQAQTRVFYQLEKLWDVAPPEAEPAAKAPRARRKTAKSARPAKAARAGRRKPRAKTRR